MVASVVILVLVALVNLISTSHVAHINDDLVVRALLAQYSESVSQVALEPLDNSDAGLTVPEIITKYGYPVEVFSVVTEDNYILEVHRIPYSPKLNGTSTEKKVVWLQHGILADSSNWIVNGVEKGLAYMLSDLGYDVWLGNARGNTYSKNHTELPVGKNFWDFSFDEMGRYDLPAVMDTILDTTGVDSIYFIGHSMGTTMFFVFLSERPEYNSKVRFMSALAPVSYINHLSSPIKLLAPFANQVEFLLRLLGVHELLPSSELMDFFGKTVCHQQSLIQELCSNILFLVSGYNSAELDRDLLPVILAHTPAGASTKTVLHYTQGINGKDFRRYDYGKYKNLEMYGQETPPKYQLQNIQIPIAIYWGANDWIADRADVYRLAEELPNLQRIFRVPQDQFGHLDFLWAVNAVPLINQPVIDFLENF